VRDDERELYDLKNDPLCKENIVFKPENKALAVQLQEMLRAGWQKQILELDRRGPITDPVQVKSGY
jgi:hypothetical protein